MTYIEEILRYGRVRTKCQNPEPSGLPTYIVEIDRYKAIWKPRSTYNYEVAAYKVSHFSGFNLVPPTVDRNIDGQMGSVQLWVSPTIDKSQALSSEFDKQYCFDFLINHGEDRGPGHNCVVLPNGLIQSIDHERAFAENKPKPNSEAIARFLKTDECKNIILNIRDIGQHCPILQGLLPGYKSSELLNRGREIWQLTQQI